MQKLPTFSQIQPEHIVPAIEQVLNENRAKITQLVDSKKFYAWDNFIQLTIPFRRLLKKMNSAIFAYLASIYRQINKLVTKKFKSNYLS